ncbi:MAG: hypothetical protein HOW73_18860 [Polyangiaceae bacterium]|nr:hypothetical protein [Polyangiaceae bacterium]
MDTLAPFDDFFSSYADELREDLVDELLCASYGRQKLHRLMRRRVQSGDTTMHDIADVEAELTVSRQTLEAAPARALALLRAVATSLPIRAALAEHGYTVRDHEEGMNLLLACIDVGGDLAEGFELDRQAHRAIAELDAWDDSGYLKLRTVLHHRYPAQAEFLLRGLAPETEMRALSGVRKLLERFAEMEADSKPDGACKGDRAALAFLEKKGFGEGERERLRRLLRLVDNSMAQGPGGVAKDAATADLERLGALRKWHDRWASRIL